MTYDTSTANDIGSTRYPVRASFMAITARPWQMLANLMMQRQTRTALSSLNDHMLKDIGISRGEIERISRNVTPARFTRFGR